MTFASVPKSKGKSDFAQRIKTALNKQLSISSIASNEGEDNLIAIPVSKGGAAILEGAEKVLQEEPLAGGRERKENRKERRIPPPRGECLARILKVRQQM